MHFAFYGHEPGRGQGAECGSLNENIAHGLINLDTQVPLGGTVWEDEVWLFVGGNISLGMGSEVSKAYSMDCLSIHLSVCHACLSRCKL